MKYSISENQNLGSVYGPLMRIIESDTLAYRVLFAKSLKSPIAAIVLSQYLYWARNISAVERGGWFFKTEEQLYDETGVTEKSQRTVRKVLISKGILIVQKRGVPAKNWYKIDYTRLAEFIYENAPAITSWGIDDDANMDDKKCPTGSTGSAKRGVLSYTEITTEREENFSEKISSPLYKPNTEKGWRDLRRAEIGKEPTRTPRTEKQAQTFDALKWKDYFREEGYRQHGMQFFLVNAKGREAKVSKLMIDAKKTVPDIDFKGLIDWWFSGNGEWAQYEPEQCFMGKTIESFLNGKKRKKTGYKKGSW